MKRPSKLASSTFSAASSTTLRRSYRRKSRASSSQKSSLACRWVNVSHPRLAEARLTLALQDLLNVTAELSSLEPPTDDSLTKAAGTPSFFDSQLYLFEAVGTLISILNQIPDQQVTLLRAVLTPLLVGLQANTRTTATSPEDFQAVFQAHHLMMAAGNVAKGFPDLSARTPVASGAWVEVFKEATEQILTVAKSMGGFVIIRDAVSRSGARLTAPVLTSPRFDRPDSPSTASSLLPVKLFFLSSPPSSTASSVKLLSLSSPSCSASLGFSSLSTRCGPLHLAIETWLTLSSAPDLLPRDLGHSPSPSLQPRVPLPRNAYQWH